MIGDFWSGDDGSYARDPESFRSIDVTDASVWVWTAENFAPEKAREIDVSGINGATGNLVRPFRPRNGSTNH